MAVGDLSEAMTTGRASGAPSKRVAIMQPYLFPYLGYFQLMVACDEFIVFDDAQYVKLGWINRNRILLNGSPEWLGLPVRAAAHELPVNQRKYQFDSIEPRRFLRRIEGVYRKAPFFPRVFSLLQQIIGLSDDNVARFNANQLRTLAKALGIGTPILLASQLAKDMRLKNQELVIDICTSRSATEYVNAIGGKHLYRASRFSRDGMSLRFLHSEAAPYEQFGQPFVPGLSIIDVMMFNPADSIGTMLWQYSLRESNDHEGGEP